MTGHLPARRSRPVAAGWHRKVPPERAARNYINLAIKQMNRKSLGSYCSPSQLISRLVTLSRVYQRKPAGQTDQAGDGCPHPDPLLRAVFELAGLLRGRAQGIGRDLALPPPVAMALAQISGTISMRELGQRLGCERSFITVIADELERRALIQREPHHSDRRVKNLVLTP
jgi:hypothetical protein